MDASSKRMQFVLPGWWASRSLDKVSGRNSGNSVHDAKDVRGLPDVVVDVLVRALVRDLS